MVRKGISVCIPVYRYPVQNLIDWISRNPPSLDFEVLVFIDGPNKEYIQNRNLPLTLLGGTGERLGVAQVRKALVEAAEFDFILFLDADVIPLNGAYFSILEHYKNQTKVVVGGYAYFKIDFERGRRLRYYYGRAREQAHASIRNESPFNKIFLGNFLIKKDLMLEILADWPTVLYGHEDTLLGFRLEKLGIKPTHIENPVRHIPSDSNEAFLVKTRLATSNLFALQERFPELKATKLAAFAQKLPAKYLIKSVLGLIEGSLSKHLKEADRPLISTLDLLKLYWYLELEESYSSTI